MQSSIHKRRLCHVHCATGVLCLLSQSKWPTLNAAQQGTRLTRAFLSMQAARVLSTSATQGGASFLDAAGAGLLTAGERLQRAADGLPFRWGIARVVGRM